MARPFQPGSRWILAVLALLAVALTVPSGVSLGQSSSEDERFVTGLRDRRLYALAASYCQRRLQSTDLSEQARAELVVLLSQTYVQHALDAKASDADGLWQQAAEETLQYAQQFPNSRWKLVVNTQAALVLVARGEFLRQQAEVSADSGATLNEARGYLRTGIRALRMVEEELSAALRDQSLPPEGAPSRAQLLALQKNLRYELARAYMSQGQCYDPETPDRDNALRQAIELLDGLTRLNTVDPLAFKARLDEVNCLRLMKDYTGALRKLDALAGENPPPAIAQQADAQRLRVLLAADRLVEAKAFVEKVGKPAGGHPQWDFALLEYGLAMWAQAHQAGKTDEASQWERLSAEQVKHIETSHAPYWARRAEALLASRIHIGGGSSDLDLQVRAAQGFYRGGQWNDAIAAYEQAAAMARDQGQRQAAFDLEYLAAGIEHEQNRHLPAATRLRRLALAMPEHRKAAEAHLLGVFHAGQAVKAGDISVDDYEAYVREHLKHWPQAPTAAHAQIYLGNLLEYRREWQGAVEAFRAVAPEDPQFEAAVAGAERAYRGWIASLQAAGEPYEPTLRAAAEYFEQVFLGPQAQWPRRWSMAQRTAALAAARLRLHQTPPDFDRASRILNVAISGQPLPDESWRAAATAEQAVALAGLGRLEDAERLLASAAADQPLQRLEQLQRLQALADEESDPNHRSLIAKLTLKGLESIKPEQLPATAQPHYRRLLATAKAGSGDIAGAIPLFEQLLAEQPRDAALLEAFAQCLASSNDPQHLKQALGRWREIERNTKAGTPLWFRAKYGLASTYEKLGEPAYAVRLIKVTAVLHPELGGAEMKARFDELLKRCGG